MGCQPFSLLFHPLVLSSLFFFTGLFPGNLTHWSAYYRYSRYALHAHFRTAPGGLGNPLGHFPLSLLDSLLYGIAACCFTLDRP